MKNKNKHNIITHNSPMDILDVLLFLLYMTRMHNYYGEIVIIRKVKFDMYGLKLSPCLHVIAENIPTALLRKKVFKLKKLNINE